MICCTSQLDSPKSAAMVGNDGRKVSMDSGLIIDRLASSSVMPSVGAPRELTIRNFKGVAGDSSSTPKPAQQTCRGFALLHGLDHGRTHNDTVNVRIQRGHLRMVADAEAGAHRHRGEFSHTIEI